LRRSSAASVPIRMVLSDIARSARVNQAGAQPKTLWMSQSLTGTSAPYQPMLQTMPSGTRKKRCVL
jgi:hypothetical protein